MLIAGGGRLDGTGITSAEIYDPVSGTFTPTGELQFGRWARSAALLPDGRVLVAGGGGEAERGTAELFDPASGTWSRTGDLNVPRSGHTLTALSDGRVLISGAGPLELYEPEHGRFRLLDLEPPGDRPTATLLLDGRVLLIGGNDRAEFTPGLPNGHGSGPATTRAVAFDPTTEELQDAGEMLQVRSSHSAVLLGDGRVLASGGAQDVHHDEPVLTSAELWDPSTETFAPTGEMDEPRFGHTMTLLRDGSVLVAGEISDVRSAHAQRYVAPPRTARTIGELEVPAATGEPAEVRSLGAEPESPFEPWNGEDVVLYDTLTMTETNLGPGYSGFRDAFSPDGTRFAWTAGPPTDLSEVWVLDLETRERRLVATGVIFRWLDDDTLYGRQPMGENTNGRLDVTSGEWSAADDIDPNDLFSTTESERWRLELPDLELLGPDAYPFWTREFVLHDRTGVLAPLRFEAYQAILAADGGLFIATTPEDQSGPSESLGPHIESGTTEIYEVDPQSGEATYIATAEASAPGWAFDASVSHVAWLDGFCAVSDFSSLRTGVLDRSTRAVTYLDRGLWLSLTPDGQIGVGQFGARALIDLDTLNYTVVLPTDGWDISWSPDYRYAAVGFTFGHGGRCG